MENGAFTGELSDLQKTDPRGFTRESITGSDESQATVTKQTVPGVLTLFTQEAGLSGVKHVGNRSASTARRLLWLIIVLAALSGLLFQVSTMITSFTGNPVNVNIEYVEPTQKPDFPAITICNNNMFKSLKVQKFVGGTSYFFHYFPYLHSLFSVDGESIYDGIMNLTIPNHVTFGFGNTLLDFVEMCAHEAKDMIKSCSFGGLPCGPENFTRVITNYGVCFTFNSAEHGFINQVKNEGQRYGLKLLLHAEENQYSAPRTEVGFRLMVHGQDEIPDIANQGISISPGASTSIALTTTTVTNLGYPYGNCVKDVHRNLKYFNGSYSVSKCWIECETNYIVQQCNCRYFYMPGDAEFCTPAQLQTCYFEKMDEFAALDDPCQCDEPCTQTWYNARLSYSSYPSLIHSLLLTDLGKWPCDEAMGLNLIVRSFTDLEVAVEHFYKEVEDTYHAIVSKGQNVSTFFDADLFHSAMIHSIHTTVYTDVMNEAGTAIFLHTLHYLMGESDEVGSEFYNDTKSHISSLYMNPVFLYWVPLKYEARYLLRELNFTADVIEDLIDILIQDYYLPMFEDLFPVLYANLKDVRDGKLDSVQNDRSICKSFSQSNLAKITIYFEDMKIENIVQKKAYEFFNLVCDIGGTLGLFFGASMVTFLEILDFFAVHFCLTVRR
ncbi:acid-sensing ion channel 1A-like [Ptychodera flava]|uniref:acid-sensing ion channel 1A-like n=1 Tax=Ptychodera flava TaxID=63121 RepID=UPI00396A7E84